MIPKIQKIFQCSPDLDTIIIVKDINDLSKSMLTKAEFSYLKKNHETHSETKIHSFNRFDYHVFIVEVCSKNTDELLFEDMRKAAFKIVQNLKALKIKNVQLSILHYDLQCLQAFLESMVLSSYEFTKYKTEKTPNSLELIFAEHALLQENEVDELNIVCDATYRCRDMVNEPVNYLDAIKISEEFIELAQNAGCSIEVFNKKKIEALKMGGLLAVNSGSKTPPTFTVMEYKPKNAVNKKPLVFVGKGVVYDTGGLNIKTGNSMDGMKCDMAGAAAVATALYAIAKSHIAVWVISVVPATDNRPGENAYTNGDVIRMHNGKTVEVLNTDAEGRLILADALSYVQKFKPQCVIDLATLTGSAVRAIGSVAMVGMNKDAAKEFILLQNCGNKTHERIVEFPLWEDYGAMIKSDIADIKNIGGAEAGAITAGKFLEHFTSYPWIHLDIAGPAFTSSVDSYRGLGGTGWGTRILVEFAKSML